MVRGIGRLAVGHHQFPYPYTAAVVFLTILQVASAFHMPVLEATNGSLAGVAPHFVEYFAFEASVVLKKVNQVFIAFGWR